MPENLPAIENPIVEDWYEALVEDCKAIITEAVFVHNWALVEGYWHLGERIDQDIRSKPINKIQLFQDLGKSISKCSRTTFYDAHRVYRKFPSLDLIPEGKKITWYRLVTHYLPETSAKEKEINDLALNNHCPRCGYEWN